MQGYAVNIPVKDTNPGQDQTRAVKLTRSQLAKKPEQDVEPKSLIDGIGQTSEERDEEMKEERITKDITFSTDINMNESTHDAASDSVAQMAIDASASPLPTAVPKLIGQLRAESPSKRSTSNKENVEPRDIAETQSLSLDGSDVAAVPIAPPPPSAPQDPITALDELDDAVEDVNKNIPDVQTSPEKPKTKKMSNSKKDSEKAAPVVRGTKASQARISLAQNTDVVGKTPSLGRARPSTTIGRSSSVRQTSTSKPDFATKRVTSTSTTKPKPAAETEKKDVIIPHSKPRPVSMSFPAPPPPAKSTKAPTTSTFQLPGEAVAAKLRAAREARMHKAPEDEDKKKAFKARPVPTSLSKAPSIRQTTASKARESITTGKDPKASAAIASATHKRASSVAVSRPAAPLLKPRIVPKDATKPTAGELTVKKRASTALANISKPRASTTTVPGPTASTITSNSTIKGKEVFNRPAAAKAAAEKEKLEKEAAAKKARADAAERGRQASREWAEKQKRLAAAKKAGASGKESKAMNGHAIELAKAEAPILEEATPAEISTPETGAASA